MLIDAIGFGLMLPVMPQLIMGSLQSASPELPESLATGVVGIGDAGDAIQHDQPDTGERPG